VGNPASLRREVEASLRRLGVDRIDLYQLHWPAEDGTPLEEYWQTFADLRTEGKIRAAGLSNHNLAQLMAAEAVGHVDSLQPQFSLIHRDNGAKLIPWCRDHGTGVIVYSPMGAGLLTGAFNPERAANLDRGDWRSRSSDFSGDGLTRNLALVDGLRPVADRLGVSLGAVAVAWTLAFPGVSGAIVGARSPRQVDGWLAAAELVLDGKDLTEIAAAVASSGAGTGPSRPA
jgi:aryl-alcohol dehydrogenase-like predicted oxidoreductase